MDSFSERARAAHLLDAQEKASELFEKIGRRLIRPNVSESQLTREIGELAQREFGVETNWHKRVVRVGTNTLCTFYEDPPEQTTGEDDLVFVDLGPVFSAWEADFGRTYVIGNDPLKKRLVDDCARAFAKGKQYYQTHPDLTGAEYFAFVKTLAEEGGWEFAGPIAAHLVGEFPHKGLPENMDLGYANEKHHVAMRGLDSKGRERHWILEIHLVDRARRIGGFYEELLTLG